MKRPDLRRLARRLAPAMASPPPRSTREALTPAALQRSLRATLFGHRVYYYPSIGSTNDRALECAAAGVPEGALVLAEEQTGGRGRRARTWASAPYLGIYASLILRPSLPASRAPLFTLMAAVSTADVLNEVCGIRARIKWPNDVLVGGRKIAGVLGEVRGSHPDIRELVVGMGINVNHAARDFPADLLKHATSVRIEKGSPFSRAAILAAVLDGFERRYARLLREGPDMLLREWESRSTPAPGERVEALGPSGRAAGLFQGIDEEGALLLTDDAGARIRIPFGDIVTPPDS